MMGLSDGRKSFPIGLAVLIQYRSVTDTQPATQPRRCSYYAQRSGVEPKNGYNQYYFALDSTFFRGRLKKTEASRGQMLEAETNLSRPRPKFLGQNFGLEATLASTP